MSNMRFTLLVLSIVIISMLFITLSPHFDNEPSHVRLSCPPVEVERGCLLYVVAPHGVDRVDSFWGTYRGPVQLTGLRDVVAGLKYSLKEYRFFGSSYAEQNPVYWRYDGEFVESVGMVVLIDNVDRASANVLAIAEIRPFK